MPPAATGDQTVKAAVVLVCDAPARAQPEIRKGVGASDAIAQHLTDGVGNDRVLTVWLRMLGNYGWPPVDFWFAPISAMLLWPVLFLALDRLRRRSRARSL